MTGKERKETKMKRKERKRQRGREEKGKEKKGKSCQMKLFCNPNLLYSFNKDVLYARHCTCPKDTKQFRTKLVRIETNK